MVNRRCAAVVAICLGVLAVAAPAHAVIHTIASANSAGPEESFATNEALWAIGTSNPLGGIGQICVVAPDVTAGECEEESPWGGPNAIAVLGTFLQPVVGNPPPLPPGTWRLLADNGDAEFDKVSAPFTVGPCTAGDCTSAIAQAELEEWKQTAAAARVGPALACIGLTIYQNQSRDDALQVVSGVLSDGLRGYLMGELKGSTIDFLKPEPALDKALQLLASVSCGAWVMYSDIVADPPDPEYKLLAEPQIENLYFRRTGVEAADAAAEILAELRGLAAGPGRRAGGQCVLDRHRRVRL